MAVTYLGYGPPGPGGRQPTLWRRGSRGTGVPAVAAMRLDYHQGATTPVAWTRWRALGRVLATTPGAGGWVDLRPAQGARVIYVDVQPEVGAGFTLAKTTLLTAPTPADEARYAPPSYGCRIPYADLERITPDQARARAATPGGLAGCLVEGALMLDQVGVAAQEDFVVEARARSAFLLASKGKGRGYFDLAHVTVTGLQRDRDGQPVTAWDVDRVTIIGGSTLAHADLSWGNDTAFLGTRGQLVASRCHSHTDYVNSSGVRQHPDGVQMQQGGGQVVRGCLLDGSLPDVPTRADGAPVRVVTRRARSSQSVMINNAMANGGLQGLVTVVDNTLADGGAVHLNMVGGVNDTGLPWYVQQGDADGTLVRGLVLTGNRVTVASQLGDITGPGDVTSRLDPSNRREIDGVVGPMLLQGRKPAGYDGVAPGSVQP